MVVVVSSNHTMDRLPAKSATDSMVQVQLITTHIMKNRTIGNATTRKNGAENMSKVAGFCFGGKILSLTLVDTTVEKAFSWLMVYPNHTSNAGSFRLCLTQLDSWQTYITCASYFQVWRWYTAEPRILRRPAIILPCNLILLSSER